MSTNADQPPFNIEICKGRMQISLRAGKHCGELAHQQVIDAMLAAGISVTDAMIADVEAVCVRGITPKPREVVGLTHGVAPVHAIPPRVELLEQKAPEGFGRERCAIATTIEGTIIGTVIDAIPGIDGRDVFGEIIPHVLASPEVPLGPNVRLSEDGKSVIAAMDGLVQCRYGKVCVENFMEIAGNLDFSTGNVNFAGSVLIRGSVADLFRVAATQDIYVGGAVEAADIVGGHDVEIHGGICCRDKGYVRAGHDLRAKFLCNTTVEARNDVIVHAEVANSRVICSGKLRVEIGAIYTSHITAAGGVVAASLGSPAHAKTMIECGIDAALRKSASEKLPEIQASLTRVEKVRDVVAPLLQNLRTLSPPQKEKATEMLYESDQLQREADHVMKQIAADYQQYQQQSKSADVYVSGTIYPGVTIRFPKLETTIRMPIKGPTRIQCREVHGAKAIVAINDLTGHTQLLELRRIDDEVMDQLVQALNASNHLRETDPTQKGPEPPLAA